MLKWELDGFIKSSYILIDENMNDLLGYVLLMVLVQIKSL